MASITGENQCPHCHDECCVEGCHIECSCMDVCGNCCHVAINIGPEQDIAAGTIIATSSVDGLFYPYDPAGVDGLNMPRGILMHGSSSDEHGNVTSGLSLPWIGGDCLKKPYTNMYVEGTFKVEETIGDLAAALSVPSFGRMITGQPNSVGVWKLV